MSTREAVTVTMTLTVTMTPEQAEAYAAGHGNEFVTLEIADRLRQEGPQALQQLPWLQGYGTVEIAKPARTKHDPGIKGDER